MAVTEPHSNLEQSTLFQIEILSENLAWSPLPPNHFRKDGKYIIWHKDFIQWTKHKSRHYEVLDKSFSFTDESVALEFAKALAHVSHLPLRVMRVQRIRIQKQISKIILPVGGL